MTKIQRFRSDGRLSEMTIYNGVIYLAGQVPQDGSKCAYEQTKEVLQIIDDLLKEVGSCKSKILNAQIYLANMQDYAKMNQAWDEWVDRNNTPSRATVEAKLAYPEWKVEIVITAAL